ncbi:MAG: sulfotransferase [Rubrobacter sp.]|nr:sulfotransferase [Rubrobacter sp.]
MEVRSREKLPDASGGRVKVLYVAGLGRSGSTLLGNVLGQVEGFVPVGEVRSIWEYGLSLNKVCACGALFDDCEMWRPVMDEAFGGKDGLDPRKMIRLREGWARTRHIPLVLAPPGRRLIEWRLAEYLDGLERLYRAVLTTTGGRVIVDTSKFPSYGFVLGMVPSVDLRVVHLVRDPRAVAYSWQQKRLQPDPENPEYMDRYSPMGSSLRWMARNLGTEAFWRRSPKNYLLLRYEDFVAEPQRTIRRILGLVQEETALLPHVSEHEVELGVNHNIWGNPSRFRTGKVEVRPDREWASRIDTGDARVTTFLTFLLLIRYGYSLAVGDRNPASG